MSDPSDAVGHLLIINPNCRAVSWYSLALASRWFMNLVTSSSCALRWLNTTSHPTLDTAAPLSCSPSEQWKPTWTSKLRRRWMRRLPSCWVNFEICTWYLFDRRSTFRARLDVLCRVLSTGKPRQYSETLEDTILDTSTNT